jgi:flagellar motor switch protein FliN/FliY
MPFGELVDDGSDDQYVVWPLLDGSERVAAIVIRVSPTIDAAPATVTVHEFPTLQDTEINLGDARPLSLLHDVEMGVTAELGRRRMTVRDLLSLTPGAVIELDRAAGSPVDVLVNGTLIARGEVVVIDEEFGIRISEIVAPDPAGAH